MSWAWGGGHVMNRMEGMHVMGHGAWGACEGTWGAGRTWGQGAGYDPKEPYVALKGHLMAL